MSNICFTQYAVVQEDGGTQQLKSLHDTLCKLEKTACDNGFTGNARRWLGDIVAHLGGDPEACGCDGYWTENSLDREKGVLTLWTETAWGPCDDVTGLIADSMPGIRFFYLTEEPGEGLFETNDAEGRFFPERCILDSCCDTLESRHFNSLEEAARYLSAFFGRKLTTEKQIGKAIDRHNERHGDELFFNMIEVADD